MFPLKLREAEVALKMAMERLGDTSQGIVLLHHGRYRMGALQIEGKGDL